LKSTPEILTPIEKYTLGNPENFRNSRMFLVCLSYVCRMFVVCFSYVSRSTCALIRIQLGLNLE